VRHAGLNWQGGGHFGPVLWRNAMPLMSVVLSLIFVGVILYLVNNYIPMDRKIKTIINGVVVIFVLLWLLRVFSVLDTGVNFPTFR
jgi:cytochrome c biogenesis protein CcdA